MSTQPLIAKIELFKVPPRWQFVKISTSDGNFGWGEPILEGKADTVAACIAEMSHHLLGKPAGHIEDLFQVMHRGGFYRGGPIISSAISGIEQALWDAKGKRLGVPIYELLGGPVRERVRLYSWIGGDQPEKLAHAARERVAQGYTGLKMNVTHQTDWIDSAALVDGVVAKTAAVREAIGAEVGLALDFHGRVHRGMAKVLLRELEPFRLMFVEEPVLVENFDAMREIARGSSVPIATGERLYTRWGFKQLLSDGVVDVIQPDISHAGGLWECRKIAAMAEAYDIAVALHCPLGPIALAASLQLDFCTPNAFIQEQVLGLQYGQASDKLDYLVGGQNFGFQDGFVPRSEKAGLGIEIDEAKVREAALTGHNWRNPGWRLPDGSFAEW